MEEHPVALAIYILSPKSWVIELCVRGLAAARAGAGELEKGLLELAALDGGLFEFLCDIGLFAGILVTA